jgi:hypothetical protein
MGIAHRGPIADSLRPSQRLAAARAPEAKAQTGDSHSRHAKPQGLTQPLQWPASATDAAAGLTNSTPPGASLGRVARFTAEFRASLSEAQWHSINGAARYDKASAICVVLARVWRPDGRVAPTHRVILAGLTGSRLSAGTPIGSVPVHVLEERVHDNQAVRVAELAAPEALEVVAPGIVPEPPDR